MADETVWPGDVNLAFMEGLYSDYLRQPDSVPPEWRRYFDSLGDKPVNGAIRPVAERPAAAPVGFR